MFGMGGSEIIVILIVALLFLGPDKLPEAAKQISKGIRDIKKQSRTLQQSIENDETIGGAIRDIKSALRGDEPAIRPKPVVPKKPPQLAAGDDPAGGNSIGGAAVAATIGSVVVQGESQPAVLPERSADRPADATDRASSDSSNESSIVASGTTTTTASSGASIATPASSDPSSSSSTSGSLATTAVAAGRSADPTKIASLGAIAPLGAPAPLSAKPVSASQLAASLGGKPKPDEAAVAPVTDEHDEEVIEKPLVRLSPLAGEADPDVATSDDANADDAELASLIRPPSGAVARK